jgi:hypothetical protein
MPACGDIWPCSPAKLRLLGVYREDRAALTVHLEALLAETYDLTEKTPVDLTHRIVGWARPRRE